MRLTNKDVEEFNNSEAVSAARDLLKRAEDGAELSISESSEVTDFLLCLVTIKTGQRPGALENATVDPYKSMWQDTSGKRVMLVPAHKRGVSGPAPIALDAKRSGRIFHLIPTTCFAPWAFQERAYLKAVTRVLTEICGSTQPSDNSNQYQKVDCDGMPREEAQG